MNDEQLDLLYVTNTIFTQMGGFRFMKMTGAHSYLRARDEQGDFYLQFKLRFYLCWRRKAAMRDEWKSILSMKRRNGLKNPGLEQKAIKPRAVPEWGMAATFARHVMYLFFFLWFQDLAWRKYRRLAGNPESLNTAKAMWHAYSRGYRSFRKYEFAKWLRQRDPGRYLVLPQGETPLALPEGSETVLLRQIKQIEQDAHAGCGLYYEIYEPRVLRALRALEKKLTGYDLAVFTRILPESGWDISDESYEASRRAEAEVREKIHGNLDADDY